MIQSAAFIGLGAMGYRMAAHLPKRFDTVYVWNRNFSKAEQHAAEYGTQAAELNQAVQADVIFSCLPTSADVEALIENLAIKPGAIWIDCTSGVPETAQKLAQALKAKNVDFLDAPVSGGEPKAIDGTLSVMVGGDKAIFDKYYDLLKAMAGSVVHTGDIGAGNVTKLANQVIVALNIAAMSEALTLATKAGVNPDLVYQAIRGGLAGSTVLDAKAPMVMDRNFKPGFRIDLHIKDLANALDTSHGVGAQLPLTAAVMEMMQALRADGLGTADHSALACYYEKLAKVEVTR